MLVEQIFSPKILFYPICLGAKEYTSGLPVVAESPVKLRFMSGPAAEAVAETAGERGFLHMKADKLDLQLLMSTITNLTDLVEDEKIIPAMPLLVEVTRVKVTLKVMVGIICLIMTLNWWPCLTFS